MVTIIFRCLHCFAVEIHRTNRNGHTPWSQVEEILCVNELIQINMGANMWFTRLWLLLTPVSLISQANGTTGCPLWQETHKLSRAATEKGRLCGTQYFQRALKWYTEPTVGFFARTGTIWTFGVYIYLCVYRIPYCISLAIACTLILSTCPLLSEKHKLHKNAIRTSQLQCSCIPENLGGNQFCGA